MEKYKCILSYPGAKKGDVVELNTDIINIYANKHNGLIYTYSEIKDYPQIWEKVEEKDYEILTLTPNELNAIYQPLKEIRDYKGDGISSHWQIYSIKRLSDGEIFTLGDKVVFLAEYERMNFTSKIGSFVIEDNNILVKNEGCLISSLKNIKKPKEPLFTTEDNYDILDKEELVYLLNSKTFAVTRITFNCWDKTRLLFKTKEGLNEWLLYNKPLISVQDLIDECLYTGDIEHFKEVVKSRL